MEFVLVFHSWYLPLHNLERQSSGVSCKEIFGKSFSSSWVEKNAMDPWCLFLQCSWRTCYRRCHPVCLSLAEEWFDSRVWCQVRILSFTIFWEHYHETRFGIWYVFWNFSKDVSYSSSFQWYQLALPYTRIDPSWRSNLFFESFETSKQYQLFE